MIRRISRCLALTIAGMLLLVAVATPAQACRIVDPRPVIITPEPPRPPERPRTRPIETKRHTAEIEVDGQGASVRVEAVFHNPNGVQMEGTYFFPLPADVAVRRFSMFMNGKEVKAELLDATRARQVYEDIVRRMKDPGLLEYVGMQMIKVRVFPIPARGDVKIRLAYSHLVKRDSGMLRLAYPLGSAKPSGNGVIGATAVRVKLANEIALRNIYSPTHRVDVSRPDDHHAVAGFEAEGLRPEGDFELYWATAEEAVGANVLTHRVPGEDGHFLLMLSPRVELPENGTLAKDVVFVLDKSGSMQHGYKIRQAKKALAYCLRKLRPQDTFGLVAFSTGVRPFREERLPATEENVEAAVRWLDGLDAAGGTAIDEALSVGLRQLEGAEHVPMLLFLTDGLPTVGETGVDAILKQAAEANAAKARIFAFGVGYDVNAKLLDRLAGEGRGERAYVKPKEDIEVKVSNLYEKIASPVLSDIRIAYGGVPVHDIYPKDPGDLFRGGQILLLGRYGASKMEGPHTLTVRGTAAGTEQTFTYAIHAWSATDAPKNDFLPGLWGMRKVGYLLDQIRLHGETPELVEEVKRLAKRHGLVTPYTSFLVVEDGEVRRTGGARPDDTPRRAPEEGAGADHDRLKRRIREMEEASAETFRRAESGAAAQDASRLADSYKRGGRPGKGGAPVPASRPDPASVTLGGEIDAPGVTRMKRRQVGGKTFFLRDGAWIDSVLDAAAETGGPDRKVVEVAFMSEAYFALLREHPELGPYLALGENVVVEAGGVVYKVIRADG